MSPAQASLTSGAFAADDSTEPHRATDASSFLSSETDIAEDEIRAALESVLADPRLRISERNRRFLRFVTEEKLAGRSERIKSYTIAVDVFGRASTFDSLTDPIVRIEATRLRAALTAYYEGAGADEDIVIELPRGTYVPAVRRRLPRPSNLAAAPACGTLSSQQAATVTAAVAGSAFTLALLLVAFGPSTTHPQSQAPIIAVEPVRSVSGSPTELELAQGLTQSVLSGLSRFPGMRLVYSREGRASTDVMESVPDYVMESSLRLGDDALRYWWSVRDSRTGETLWSENIDKPREGEIGTTIEDMIAARVAARIAEPYGIVGSDAPTAAGSTGPGYDCVLQARAQQALPNPARNRRIRRCLEQTVAFTPHYGDAWALLSLTYLYDEYLAKRGSVTSRDLVAMANEAAERAAQLAPHSGLAYQALLSSRFRLGEFNSAEDAAARAIELNPNDPEILHAAGLREYLRGRSEEGLAKIRKSMALATRVRPGAQFVLALDAYRRGDFDRAHDLAKAAEGPGLPLLVILCAASHAELGRMDEARSDLDALLTARPDYGREMRLDLEAFRFSAELADILVAGARKAGLAVQ